MPSHELAGDVFNNIVIVHDCQNNSLRYSLLRLAAETWLIGRMSRKLYELLWLEHRVEVREHHSCAHPTCNSREQVCIIQNDYSY